MAIESQFNLKELREYLPYQADVHGALKLSEWADPSYNQLPRRFHLNLDRVQSTC
jgi:hypothetical protein